MLSRLLGCLRPTVEVDYVRLAAEIAKNLAPSAVGVDETVFGEIPADASSLIYRGGS